jgi:hypothetical protein
MPIVRIEHVVPNYEKWKQVFDSDPVGRKGLGVRRYEVLRQRDDPNFVMIDLELDTVEAAEAFVAVMQRIWAGPGKAVMQGPVARIVDLVEEKKL